MPYIKADDRPELDLLMAPIIERIASLPVEAQDGALNYVVTRIIKSTYPRRYFHYNRAMGVLACIQQELYRLVVGPYEDEKIEENGPVEPHEVRPAPRPHDFN